jgi:hypothetical protein
MRFKASIHHGNWSPLDQRRIENFMMFKASIHKGKGAPLDSRRFLHRKDLYLYGLVISSIYSYENARYGATIIPCVSTNVLTVDLATYGLVLYVDGIRMEPDASVGGGTASSMWYDNMECLSTGNMASSLGFGVMDIPFIAGADIEKTLLCF